MAMLPQHPNVVRYYGTVLQKPNYALVMEYWCAAQGVCVRACERQYV